MEDVMKRFDSLKADAMQHVRQLVAEALGQMTASAPNSARNLHQDGVEHRASSPEPKLPRIASSEEVSKIWAALKENTNCLSAVSAGVSSQAVFKVEEVSRIEEHLSRMESKVSKLTKELEHLQSESEDSKQYFAERGRVDDIQKTCMAQDNKFNSLLQEVIALRRDAKVHQSLADELESLRKALTRIEAESVPKETNAIRKELDELRQRWAANLMREVDNVCEERKTDNEFLEKVEYPSPTSSRYRQVQQLDDKADVKRMHSAPCVSSVSWQVSKEEREKKRKDAEERMRRMQTCLVEGRANEANSASPPKANVFAPNARRTLSPHWNPQSFKAPGRQPSKSPERAGLRARGKESVVLESSSGSSSVPVPARAVVAVRHEKSPRAVRRLPARVSPPSEQIHKTPVASTD
jgi:archaellum component FlaC